MMAENEVLELLRGQVAVEFEFSVSVRNGRWVVTLGNGKGEGKTFAEAWRDIKLKPWWKDARAPL